MQNARQIISVLLCLPTKAKRNSSNRMILTVVKSSYMPHNIQPDKILSISASTIALFLSFVVPPPPAKTPPSLLRESIKSRTKFAWNYFSFSFFHCLYHAFGTSIWRSRIIAIHSLPSGLFLVSLSLALLPDGQQIKIKSLITPWYFGKTEKALDVSKMNFWNVLNARKWDFLCWGWSEIIFPSMRFNMIKDCDWLKIVWITMDYNPWNN